MVSCTCDRCATAASTARSVLYFKYALANASAPAAASLGWPSVKKMSSTSVSGVVSTLTRFSSSGMVSSHPRASFARVATGADHEACLRVETDELVGPIGRAGRRGLDDHRGLRRVHRSLAEGVRAHQSVNSPVTARINHLRRRRTAAYSRRSTTSSAGEGEACILRCTFARSRGLGGRHLTMDLGSFQRTERVVEGTLGLRSTR